MRKSMGSISSVEAITNLIKNKSLSGDNLIELEKLLKDIEAPKVLIDGKPYYLWKNCLYGTERKEDDTIRRTGSKD